MGLVGEVGGNRTEDNLGPQILLEFKGDMLVPHIVSLFCTTSFMVASMVR